MSLTPLSFLAHTSLVVWQVDKHDDLMRSWYSKHLFSDSALQSLTTRMQVPSVPPFFPPPGRSLVRNPRTPAPRTHPVYSYHAPTPCAHPVHLSHASMQLHLQNHLVPDLQDGVHNMYAQQFNLSVPVLHSSVPKPSPLPPLTFLAPFFLSIPLA